MEEVGKGFWGRVSHLSQPPHLLQDAKNTAESH